MKKHKTPKFQIIIFAVAFILLALLMGLIYTTGLHRPPIVYALIPQATKEYLNLINDLVPDQGLFTVDRGPFDWENQKDEGNSKDWAKEENDNFYKVGSHG